MCKIGNRGEKEIKKEEKNIPASHTVSQACTDQSLNRGNEETTYIRVNINQQWFAVKQSGIARIQFRSQNRESRRYNFVNP